MKHFKAYMIFSYILFGALPTILLFATHDVMCKYDMNPLCYIECALPAIITLPILMLDGTDF